MNICKFRVQEAKRELAGLDGEDGEDMQGQESAVETPARLEVFTETPTPIKNIDPNRFSVRLWQLLLRR